MNKTARGSFLAVAIAGVAATGIPFDGTPLEPVLGTTKAAASTTCYDNRTGKRYSFGHASESRQRSNIRNLLKTNPNVSCCMMFNSGFSKNMGYKDGVRVKFQREYMCLASQSQWRPK